MRNFVTTFNYGDNSIMLAVNTNAPVGVSAGGVGVLTIVVLIFGSLILLCCITGGVWFYKHRRDFKDQEEEFDEENYEQVDA